MNWPAIIAIAVAIVATIVAVHLKRDKNELSRMMTERSEKIAKTAIQVYEEHAREHTAKPAGRFLQPSQPVRLADRYKVLHDGDEWEAGMN